MKGENFEMKKVTAILGDHAHDGELSKRSLLEALNPLIEEEKLEVNFASVTDMPAVLKSNPDVIVLYAWGRSIEVPRVGTTWLSEVVSDQIVNYVENGGAWLAWHTGMSSYDSKSSYIKMLRGYFISHPVPKLIKYTASDATIFGQQIMPFEFVDEHYFVHCDESNTNVFLRSFSEDGQSIAGWHHQHGEGLVCCLTPAHTHEGLFNASFLTVLQHAIRWTASL